jgi:hypothetical protein
MNKGKHIYLFFFIFIFTKSIQILFVKEAFKMLFFKMLF